MTTSGNRGRGAERWLVRGIVQGVGFRPYVWRLAQQHHLAGWIRNGPDGVEIFAEGTLEDLEHGRNELQSRPPPGSRIDAFAWHPAAGCGAPGFHIAPSASAEQPRAVLTPDLGICDDCCREMRDPANRRFQYSYISCAHCGPRFTILESLPFDRVGTVMRRWPLCRACQDEYDNPADRRFHAQAMCCPDCGPQFRLEDADGSVLAHGAAGIAQAALLLREGRILAVQGVGGFQLACDAQQVAVVATLRERKFRRKKPLALLVPHLDAAREWVELTEEGVHWLAESSRPIVLARARRLLPGVAPESDELGVMLPAAPVQALLFDLGAPSPLVFTSGNRSQEPMAHEEGAARLQLAGVADFWLTGERPILRRADDSVVALRNGRRCCIRRGRGIPAGPVAQLPATEPILAWGGDGKNALALVVDGQVFVSPHIGDLGDAATEQSLLDLAEDWRRAYGLRPAQIVSAYDLHPEYRSTKLALEQEAARHVPVQHHAAHVASILAEHGELSLPVVGVTFDGSGFGSDGTLWGGEFLVGSVRTGWQRVASLRPFWLPGGDAAARFPVQAAAGFVAQLAVGSDIPEAWGLSPRLEPALRMVQRGVRCFPCSSVGRLFDAVAALLGFAREQTYEGQAAAWLENLARRGHVDQELPFPQFDFRPLLEALIVERRRGRPVADLAAAFHAALARETAHTVRRLTADHGALAVVLGGGVFQNGMLREMLERELSSDSGLRILTPRELPIHDGGLCLGQAAEVACRLAES